MSVQFVQCADLASYSAFATKARRGAIPVLACGDRYRQARWRRVLAWYSARLQTIGDGGDADSHLGAIVAVDGEFKPVAEVVSWRTGLPLRTIARCEIPELLRDSSASALTFVGSPSALDAGTVRRIAAKAAVPWTLISGRDLAGASFAAAKALALWEAHLTDGSWAVLDAIADKVSHIAPTGTVKLLGTLEAGHLDLEMDAGLVLHTHGEGAHADLKMVVLCGISSSEERSALGGTRIINGCRREKDGHLCKRRADRHTRVLPFHDLTAARLVLLTCNGYSPNGEMYPSDMCAPHSALEGTVAEIVTTLRPLGFPEAMPLECGRLAAASAHLGGVSTFVTEWAGDQGLPSAFVTIGAVAMARPRRGRQRPRIARQSKPIRQLEQQLYQFIGLRERAERWQAALASSALVRTRSCHLETGLAALRAASSQLSDASRCAESVLIEAHRTYTPHACLPLGTRLLALAAAQWDASFARALGALDRDLDPVAALHGGWASQTAEDTELCDRCRETVERRTLRLPLRSHGTAVATLCQNCGQRDLWWEGEGRVEISLPTIATPGSTVVLRAARPPNQEMWLGECAWVLVQLRDKAGGSTLYRHLLSVKGAEVTTDLQIPGACPPDLHTLKVVWIQGLTLATARRRIACGSAPASHAPLRKFLRQEEGGFAKGK